MEFGDWMIINSYLFIGVLVNLLVKNKKKKKKNKCKLSDTQIKYKKIIGHPTIKPKSIHDNNIVLQFSDDYLYLACIKFIREVTKQQFLFFSKTQILLTILKKKKKPFYLSDEERTFRRTFTNVE